MKILHVGPIKPMCDAAMGVNQSVRGLISGQVSIGLEVGLLPSVPMTQGRPIEGLASVCRIEGPRRRHYNPWFISRDWIVRILEEFGTLDLVVFHSTYIPFQTALARRCRQLGWPYIVTPHGGLTHLAQNVKRTKKRISNLLFFRSFIKQAAAVHAQSESEAIQAQSLFDIKQIIISPNGVDGRLLGASENLVPADLGDFADGVDLVLGYVGRINVYIKGIDLLLEAMAILKSLPEGPKCKFFMVGPFVTRKDKNYVLSTIKSLGLEDMVRLVGPKFGQEKWSYFLACDVFVHASRSEAGICMSLLEAMALGRPFLVTPGTNMADVIQEGGGWMSEADPDSIADTICNIYKSKQTLPAVGKRLQDFARSHFTWRKVAQQLNEEYAKIIEQERS